MTAVAHVGFSYRIRHDISQIQRTWPITVVWLDSGVQSHNLDGSCGPLGEHRNLGMLLRLRYLHARLEWNRLPHSVKAMLDVTE